MSMNIKEAVGTALNPQTGQINQITKIRLPSGEEVALTDWSARPLFSTIDLFSGFSDEEIYAFNYTESRTVSASQNMPTAALRNATLRDTNISTASAMDSTEEYLLYGIKVEVHQFQMNEDLDGFNIGATGLPVPQAPVMSFLQNTLLLELDVSEKAFPQAGLGWFNQGFGPVIAATNVPLGGRTYANQGLQTHDATDELPVPIHIGGTEQYNVLLLNPAGTTINLPDDVGGTNADAVVQLRVYFWGLHKRPVA